MIEMPTITSSQSSQKPDNYFEGAIAQLKMLGQGSISITRLAILLRVPRRQLLIEAKRYEIKDGRLIGAVKMERALLLAEAFRPKPTAENETEKLLRLNGKPMEYDPSNLPTLRQCKVDSTLKFNGRIGIIKTHVTDDPFRPQVRVMFPKTEEANKETLNLIVRRD